MQIIPRAGWNAAPPKTAPLHIALPTPHLWLHHSEVEAFGLAAVKSIQLFHMNTRGWNDIAYSFLIDRDGTVYEGRGVGIQGAHTLAPPPDTAAENRESHGICLLGDLMAHTPPKPQTDSLLHLIKWGSDQGWWHILTGGHEDAPGNATSCPGSWWQHKASTDLVNFLAFASTEPQVIVPMYDPPLVLRPIVAPLPCPTGGCWLLGDDGSVYAFGGAPFYGGPNGQPYWQGMKPARLTSRVDGKAGYTVWPTVVGPGGIGYSYP